MIVDSSAVIAMLREEPEAAEIASALARTPGSLMSAATYLETGIVLDAARDPVVSRQLDVLLDTADVRIAAVTEEQARIARAAYRDFGRGSGHPAGLNYGDCFSYALAKDSGRPLLFKGDDFGHTDVEAVLPEL